MGCRRSDLVIESASSERTMDVHFQGGLLTQWLIKEPSDTDPMDMTSYMLCLSLAEMVFWRTRPKVIPVLGCSLARQIYSALAETLTFTMAIAMDNHYGRR